MSSKSKKIIPFPNLISYYRPFDNMNELKDNEFKEGTSKFKINDKYEMVAVKQPIKKIKGYYPNFLIKNINNISKIENQNNFLLTCYFLPVLSIFTNMHNLFSKQSLIYNKGNKTITLNTQSDLSFDNLQDKNEEYKQLFYIYRDKTISQKNYNNLPNSNKSNYEIKENIISARKIRVKTIFKKEKKLMMELNFKENELKNNIPNDLDFYKFSYYIIIKNTNTDSKKEYNITCDDTHFDDLKYYNIDTRKNYQLKIIIDYDDNFYYFGKKEKQGRNKCFLYYKKISNNKIDNEKIFINSENKLKLNIKYLIYEMDNLVRN